MEASLRLGLVPMLLQLLDWRQSESSSQVTVQHEYQPVVAEAALILGPAASGWAVTAENSCLVSSSAELCVFLTCAVKSCQA